MRRRTKNRNTVTRKNHAQQENWDSGIRPQEIGGSPGSLFFTTDLCAGADLRTEKGNDAKRVRGSFCVGR